MIINPTFFYLQRSQIAQFAACQARLDVENLWLWYCVWYANSHDQQQGQCCMDGARSLRRKYIYRKMWHFQVRWSKKIVFRKMEQISKVEFTQHYKKTHLLPSIFLPSLFLSKYISLYALSRSRSNLDTIQAWHYLTFQFTFNLLNQRIVPFSDDLVTYMT